MLSLMFWGGMVSAASVDTTIPASNDHLVSGINSERTRKYGAMAMEGTAVSGSQGSENPSSGSNKEVVGGVNTKFETKVTNRQSLLYAESAGMYYGMEAGLWTACLVSTEIGIPIAGSFILAGILVAGEHLAVCHEYCNLDKTQAFGRNAYEVFKNSTSDNLLKNLHHENFHRKHNGANCILNCTHFENHKRFMNEFIANFQPENGNIEDQEEDIRSIGLLAKFLSSTHALITHFSYLKKLEEQQKEKHQDSSERHQEKTQEKVDAGIFNSLLHAILKEDLKKQDEISQRHTYVMSKLRENYCASLCNVYDQDHDRKEKAKINHALKEACLAEQMTCLDDITRD